MKKHLCLYLFFGLISFQSFSQSHSVARRWNDVLLEAIRNDFARPTVHARNLFHHSAAIFDAWAAYDSEAFNYLLGNTVGSYVCPFDGVPNMPNIQEEQEEAISFASYKLLTHRFKNSPGKTETQYRFDTLFANLGYDTTGLSSTDYSTGEGYALGNYIAQEYIAFGLQDGANELNDYANIDYNDINPPLFPMFDGNPNIEDPNRWQRLSLEFFEDQAGNILAENDPDFLSPEWGLVTPFSMKNSDLTIYERNGYDYYVYHDPGPPAYIDTANGGVETEEYKWNHSLVAKWSSHLDHNDGVMWDISPASIGNIALEDYPTSHAGLRNFYDVENGGDPGQGHSINPSTNSPYMPQIVPRGDYTRVLAEFWADGPASETPPGHWFTILNYVNDHPKFEKKYRGKGDVLDDLQWDVKAYFMLGGTVHDAAVAAWGVKGWYDYIRPVSAIRYMADQGQSSDISELNYDKNGITLHPGLIEVVKSGDPLEGQFGVNIGKIKLKAWFGPDSVDNPEVDEAGVGWMLAENWWPYQRPSFVTPPFAGYVSGHSTFSRAAAEMMTLLTGSKYFPGGMGEFHAAQNEFLVFEEGPSVDVTLQWATYIDASDQCSLSRIWGGIHPPVDDVPGRLMGMEIGPQAFMHADSYFNIKYPQATEAETISLIKSVFPNPASETLHVVTKGNGPFTITLNDVRGEQIYNTVSNGDHTSIPVNRVESGVYILSVQNAFSASAQKVVIK